MGELSKSERKQRGTTQVLLMRLTNERLPFAERLKKKVDRGEMLSAYELRFLEQVDASAGDVRRLIEKQPQYQEIVAKMSLLYAEILKKHNENVENNSPRT